ncbi:hypothetical protein RP20_CCG019945 [Aedes albopictus]|nr:hypothetical protein RP20_CCG019945 [Aedes albopictus]
MGHLNEASLKRLKQVANGIDFKNEALADCVSCLEGKQARLPFPTSDSRTTDLLELVHSDLCGPVEVPSFGGSRYFVTFVDDASKKVVVFFLERKSQVLEAFQRFKASAERQSGQKLKILRTDNGTEYVNKGFRQVLEREGIRHQTSCPYTPEQNGVAERMNRTLVEKARCMLNDAKLGKEFWAEAVSTAAYLVNRCPTRSLEYKTPEEAWTGKKPNLRHLKIFGSNVMTHVPKVKRKKFDPKSKKGIFVGYCEDTKGYRVFEPTSGEFRVSRDVVVLAEGATSASVACDHDVKPVEFIELHFEEMVTTRRPTKRFCADRTETIGFER